MKGSAFLFALVGVAIALTVLLSAVKTEAEKPFRPPPPKGEKAIRLQTAATAACHCAHKPGADAGACWSKYRELTKGQKIQFGGYAAANDSFTEECFGDPDAPEFCVTLEVNGHGACSWDEPPTGKFWPFKPALAPTQ